MRAQRTIRFLNTWHNAAERVVENVQRAVAHYPVIAEYHQEASFVDMFESGVNAYNHAHTEGAQVLENNKHVVHWLTTLCIAGYTWVGGMTVLRDPDQLSLGTFLANLRILSAIGSSWADVAMMFQQIQTVFPSLLDVAKLMNMQTDTQKRMALSHRCLEESAALRDPSLDNDLDNPLDHMQIKVGNLDFLYGRHAITYTGRLVISQGELAALVGKRGEGKSMLLKVIGGRILPVLGDEAEFFIPSHLRPLHVSVEKIFVKGTLMKNLTLGVAEGHHHDGDLTRVMGICNRLGLRDQILDFVMSDEIRAWGDTLSTSQASLVCLARAIIANHEIMVLHKPTLGHDEQTSVQIMQLLREFVDAKGVGLDPKTRDMRRPRTCVFSQTKFVGIKMADVVIHVDRVGGISHMHEEHVVPELFTKLDGHVAPALDLPERKGSRKS
eukprot:gnl/TRDRNA2_/TRDRNA2_209585_c0_seq1.p1 gnl/TRDRNA2_/TRDRNA2_209585_c0~~gnl/TRDRNA2_/TRDRNA2_209585_c0_seq1.p1  ORF type:complete len:489 (-),score=78.38 gnl/TRDRNA2_/TRDRNA2_209585_c0_seq1:154-1473(-)